MHSRTLTITEKRMEQFGDNFRFRVRGNGMLFEQIVHKKNIAEKMDQINENFRNSLRYLKHYGGYPDETATEKDMVAALEKLTTTSIGLGIKIRQDPLKEFTPFAL
jgi:hypothetical protein